MISENQSPESSQSSTPTNERSCACSTRARSTSPSTSDQSRPAPFEDVWPSTSVDRSCWRRRSGRLTSPNGSLLLRYDQASLSRLSCMREPIYKSLYSWSAKTNFAVGWGLECLVLINLRYGSFCKWLDLFFDGRCIIVDSMAGMVPTQIKERNEQNTLCICLECDLCLIQEWIGHSMYSQTWIPWKFWYG